MTDGGPPTEVGGEPGVFWPRASFGPMGLAESSNNLNLGRDCRKNRPQTGNRLVGKTGEYPSDQQLTTFLGKYVWERNRPFTWEILS